LTDERALTPTEVALLLHILDGASFEGADALRAQVSLAHVAGGIATFLGLAVAAGATASTFRAGPIPGRAFVEGTDGEPEGEVLVWVTGGYLSGLEFAWFTDEMPTEMPDADRVRLVPKV
jgi:hypothetical protein